MAKWTTLAPVLPGKEGEIANITKYMREHMNEYEESRKRASVTLERVYLMRTPQGAIVTAYNEGNRSQPEAFQTLATSGDPFDKWFFGKLHEIHGIDFTKPPEGPPPEQLFDWVDPEAKGRGKGLAFAAPVAADKIEKGKKFSEEAFRKREPEFRESRRMLKETHEFGMLWHTPMGAFLTVYLEGDDPKAGNARFANSTSPYDVWFKKEAGDVTGQDFNQPLPPIETIWEWQPKA